MSQKLVHVTLVVSDYDEAFHFYTGKLGFTLTEDTQLSESSSGSWSHLLGHTAVCCLRRLRMSRRSSRLASRQVDGSSCFYTQTSSNAITKYLNNGVRFVREPVTEPYGRVAVFEDFYGNLLDLIQPSRGG